jgi:uncharacterized coiled-coil protein SlyX
MARITRLELRLQRVEAALEEINDIFDRIRDAGLATAAMCRELSERQDRIEAAAQPNRKRRRCRKKSE